MFPLGGGWHGGWVGWKGAVGTDDDRGVKDRRMVEETGGRNEEEQGHAGGVETREGDRRGVRQDVGGRGPEDGREEEATSRAGALCLLGSPYANTNRDWTQRGTICHCVTTANVTYLIPRCFMG